MGELEEPEGTRGVGDPRLVAAVALVLALLTAACVTVIGLTNFTSFDPPAWFRIATMAPLPFALGASVVCAVIAARRAAPDPWLVVSALIVDGLSIVAFGVMLSVAS